jgi:UTP:GlnB (protein PII) uridylyltransferase
MDAGSGDGLFCEDPIPWPPSDLAMRQTSVKALPKMMDTPDCDGRTAPIADLGTRRNAAAPQLKRAKAMTMSEVRFSTAKNGHASLLEIITSGRRSVLARVRNLLFKLGIQIVRVESLVRDEGIFERFEIVEHDGAEISRRRAATIRSKVRKALRGDAPDAAA